MKYNKVLFVIPKVFASYPGALNPHLGVAYLMSVLLKNKVNTEVFDMQLNYSYSELLDKIKKYNPDLIAFSLFSFGFIGSCKLINKVKKDTNKLIIVGGPHPSAVREKILKDTKADLSVYGEGEITLLELCQGKELSEINGLIYRKDGKFIINPPREFMHNLDEIPFPAYEKFELNKYIYADLDKRLPIITARGCPFQCVYCAVRHTMGLPFRPRSAENVIGEIRHWYKLGYRFFEFVDDCFTMDMERAAKICDLIIENDLKIKWNLANGIRADRVDEELLRKMKKAGCIFLAYGLETGNREMIKRIRKNINLDKAMETFRLTKKVGIKFAVNFIIGHPDETYEKAMDSIKLAKKIPADYINFSNMVPYPGTETYEYVKEKGRFLFPEEEFLSESTTKLGDPIYETDEFTKEEREKVLKIGQAIATKSVLTYRLGLFLGNLVYPFAKSNKTYHFLRKMALGNRLGKRVFNIIKRNK